MAALAPSGAGTAARMPWFEGNNRRLQAKSPPGKNLMRLLK
jgi:hypothetical protein